MLVPIYVCMYKYNAMGLRELLEGYIKNGMQWQIVELNDSKQRNEA